MKRRSRDGQLAVLDMVPLGILVISPTGDVIFWNRCIAHWADRPVDSVVGRPLAEVFPAMLEPGRKARIEQVFSGGAPAIFSSDLHPNMLPLTLRNGNPRAQHTTVSALAESEDGSFDALIVIRDVTELSSQVKQLREAQLLRAKIEQAQRLEGLGLLAGGVAHDFNNVLSSILLNADLAIDGLPLDSPAMPHILEMQNSALHGARLAQQMLSYAGRSTLVESDIDLNGVVRDTIRLVRGSVARDIALDVSLVDEDAVACRRSHTGASDRDEPDHQRRRGDR